MAAAQAAGAAEVNNGRNLQSGGLQIRRHLHRAFAEGMSAAAQGVAHQFIMAATFGRCWKGYALSASSLSHAERPFGLAFRLYPAFSCGVQRKPTRALAGFLMGGLPLGFLG
jgi:hypothetical protein